MPVIDYEIRFAQPADAALLSKLGARTFFDNFSDHNTPEDLTSYITSSFSLEQMTRGIKRSPEPVPAGQQRESKLLAMRSWRRAAPRTASAAHAPLNWPASMWTSPGSEKAQVRPLCRQLSLMRPRWAGIRSGWGFGNRTRARSISTPAGVSSKSVSRLSSSVQTSSTILSSHSP